MEMDEGEGEGVQSREMLFLNLLEQFDSLKDVYIKFISFLLLSKHIIEVLHKERKGHKSFNAFF